MTKPGFAYSLGVAYVLLLAACSRETSTNSPASPDKSAASPAAASPEPARTREQTAEHMLTFIDTAPQCHGFRERMETAADTPADRPLKEQMSAILADANEAGCAKKQ